MQEGFNDRLSAREAYGRGIYLTTDSCKAKQCFNKAVKSPLEESIFIARAILGVLRMGLAMDLTRSVEQWAALH